MTNDNAYQEVILVKDKVLAAALLAAQHRVATTHEDIVTLPIY